MVVPKPTFRFKGEIAAFADVRSDICVSSDMFLQHAWLLTTNATLFTNILSPATAPHVHVVLIRLISDTDKQITTLLLACFTTLTSQNYYLKHVHTLLQKSLHELVLVDVQTTQRPLVRICTSGQCLLILHHASSLRRCIPE